MNKIALVLPAYNEQENLEQSVLKLYKFVNDMPCDIIIADNNSIDATPKIARELAKKPGIEYHHIERKGKGLAIRDSWLYYEGYDAYSFMDVDLSTDLEAFPLLVSNLGDVVIGSRYMEISRIKRSFKREVISKGYRVLFHLLFNKNIKDPQCGFKAISREVRDNVVPYLESDGFFFDTELIVRSSYAGYSIKEMPVTWKESSSSSLNLLRDSYRFLKEMIKLKYEIVTKTR